MNRERLEHLCVIMQRVIDEGRTFNMGSWGEVKGEKANLCNTAACALGWAALQPESIADGLHMLAVWEDDDDERHEQVILTRGDWRRLPNPLDHEIEFSPVFNDHCGFNAGAEYYDINGETANYLFDPGSYLEPRPITPEHVINRVKNVLEYGELINEDEPEADPPAPTVGFV